MQFIKSIRDYNISWCWWYYGMVWWYSVDSHKTEMIVNHSNQITQDTLHNLLLFTDCQAFSLFNYYGSNKIVASVFIGLDWNTTQWMYCVIATNVNNTALKLAPFQFQTYRFSGKLIWQQQNFGIDCRYLEALGVKLPYFCLNEPVEVLLGEIRTENHD